VPRYPSVFNDQSSFFCHVVKILAAVVFMTGCSSTGYQAPVTDLAQPPSQKISTHIVARGETLYSIAWRFNLDVERLAAANDLSGQFTIHPGQKLTLDTSRAIVRKQTNTPPPNSVTNRSKKTPAPAPVPEAVTIESRQLRWVWPANGTILAKFSGAGELSKGIDIGAKKGESVLAAESGTVVYAGDGLRGYGNLLIIKHDQNYLSAYAHNHRLLVAEGDSVKARQKIAEIGSSGTDRDKLHFEIRYNGKPVDPLRYLPKK